MSTGLLVTALGEQRVLCARRWTLRECQRALGANWVQPFVTTRLHETDGTAYLAVYDGAAYMSEPLNPLADRLGLIGQARFGSLLLLGIGGDLFQPDLDRLSQLSELAALSR